MDLKSLRYFNAVAETCHFGEAAARIHVAQPALSQTVARLEKELGVALFNRTTRKVELTDAGAYLHEQSHRLLTDMDTMIDGVRSIAAGSAGILRIGFTGTTAFPQLTRISQALKDALPDITLQPHTDLLTPVQLERIHHGQLDMGVLRGHPTAPGLDCYQLGSEPLVAALPANHRLATHGPDHPLTLADFATESFIAFGDARSNVNARVLASCHAAGFSPNIAHTAPGTSGLLALVAAGVGVAFIPESVQALQPRGVEFRYVPGTLETDLALVTRAGAASPVVRQALAVLRETGFFAPEGHTEPTHVNPLDSPTCPAGRNSAKKGTLGVSD